MVLVSPTTLACAIPVGRGRRCFAYRDETEEGENDGGGKLHFG